MSEPPPPAARPSALERLQEIGARLASGPFAVFLDFDGTLAPLVERPELARLEERTRVVLRALARRAPTGILSGRGLADLKQLTALPELAHAGSHGFEIEGPEGSGIRHEAAPGIATEIESASTELARALAAIPGALVESKRFSVAAHYRLVDPARHAELEAHVDALAARHPGLHKTHGKRVFELRPRVDWHKGRALLWLCAALGLPPAAPALYAGDDVTDEDALRVVAERGVGILVGSEPRPSAAGYGLRDPVEVRDFLEALATLLGPPLARR